MVAPSNIVGQPDMTHGTSTAESGQMSFGEALSIISHNHILRLLLPKWAYWLPVKR